MVPAGRRYITYVRVSTQKQGRSGLGLEAQQKAVGDYLATNSGQVVAEYREIETGKANDRPQLQAASTSLDGTWKQQLLICYSAATRLCRLQEAIVQQYGLDGLLWMQRGVNFAIYCILTSTVLHLVCGLN